MRLKIHDRVVLKGINYNYPQIGVINEASRKNGNRIFTVTLENGNRHTHVRIDSTESHLYIDSKCTEIFKNGKLREIN